MNGGQGCQAHVEFFCGQPVLLPRDSLELGPQYRRKGTGGPDPIVSMLDSEINVPKVKFGKVEISRLLVGCNPFVGSGHGNETWANMMRERCEKCGLQVYAAKPLTG